MSMLFVTLSLIVVTIVVRVGDTNDINGTLPNSFCGG